MARGMKTGGRKKGTPNKTTGTVRHALVLAFEGLGGVPALQAWAKKNPTEFFKLWARMMPTEVKAEVSASPTLEDLIAGSMAGRLKEARERFEAYEGKAYKPNSGSNGEDNES
ncbi:MAG: hypothetical protein ACM3VY_00125 [Candidatus Bathyarchaeota archaeon]